MLLWREVSLLIFCEGGVATQSLKTTALMCTLTGDIAKLAILKHARIVLQKNIFNARLQHVHKISTHHKEQGFPTVDACTPWGREVAFQGGSKRLIDFYLVLTVLLFSVVQGQFFSAVTL